MKHPSDLSGEAVTALRVCFLDAVPETSCDTEDCSLILYMGFSGNDRDGVAFQTGYQITQVNQYSVSTLYNSIVQQVCSQSSCYELSSKSEVFPPQELCVLRHMLFAQHV